MGVTYLLCILHIHCRVFINVYFLVMNPCNGNHNMRVKNSQSIQCHIHLTVTQSIQQKAYSLLNFKQKSISISTKHRDYNHCVSKLKNYCV